MSRLAEVLGVEENEIFYFAGREFTIKGIYAFEVKDDDFYAVSGDLLSRIISNSDEIKRIETIKLTEQQITVIKGRITEGFRWMAKDAGNEDADDELYFYVNKPERDADIATLFDDDIGSASQCFFGFDFCTWANSPINLKELLKENGVEV